MPIRKPSEAQRRAVKKHDLEKVDKMTVRLPKGTKDQINSLGYSVNAFAIEAINEKLARGLSENHINSYSQDEK